MPWTLVRSPLVLLAAVLVSGRVAGADDGGSLRLATCQFPVSADIPANGAWIRKQMCEASSQGADLVHFPECALSGYAGVDIPSTEDLDWHALDAQTEAILDLARELRVWVVLGSTHRLSGENKPHNCLYVINAEGKILDRYDKRFCTEGDLRHYSPGDHFVTFEVKGVRCGLLICYDIRFPELYREYHKRGVRLMLHSFYNARQKEGSIHPKIMPVTARAYAGVNNMFVSINNSSAPRSWPSRFITPDGLVGAKLPVDEPGVMVNVVDLRRPYYDASAPFRPDALRGKLHSGEVVDDPRSRDRTSH
jgi:predicted amidohydrolase